MQRDVLFVDDEPQLLGAIERCLRRSFNVSTATSGSAGLELISARSNPFPVVVADFRMPEMSGLEFIQTARTQSPRTQFLVLTGWNPTSALSEAVTAGPVSGLLNKPCGSRELTRALDQAVRRFDLAERQESGPGWSDLCVVRGPLEFYMLEARISLSVAGVEWLDSAAVGAEAIPTEAPAVASTASYPPGRRAHKMPVLIPSRNSD